MGYFFFIRPRSQAARRQRDTLMELSAGDEVLTGAGIFGTVLDVEADRVTLETAPGTRITVLRSTIARRITDPATEPPSWDEHDEDEAHGAYEDYEHGRDHDDEHDHDAEAHDADDHDADDHDAEAHDAEAHDAEAHDADDHDGGDHDGGDGEESGHDDAAHDEATGQGPGDAADDAADDHDTGAADGAGDQDKKKT